MYRGVSLYVKRNRKIKKGKSLSGKNQCKEAPRCTCLNGSLTIEAALILPMLACFFVCILFFFRVMQVELQVEKAMVNTGHKLAVYAAEEKSGSGKLVKMSLLKLSLMKELKDRDVVARYVTGGTMGIRLSDSVLEGDFVDVRASFKVKLPVRLLGTRDVKIVRRVRCRKWTGWNSESSGDEDEIWVYITETGTVYHRTKECSHLKLTVTGADMDSVSEKRNENGEKYLACEKCTANKTAPTQVYITSQGNRYHYDLHCSGIKRTIIMIKISEVGERSACSRCGRDEE